MKCKHTFSSFLRDLGQNAFFRYWRSSIHQSSLQQVTDQMVFYKNEEWSERAAETKALSRFIFRSELKSRALTDRSLYQLIGNMRACKRAKIAISWLLGNFFRLLRRRFGMTFYKGSITRFRPGHLSHSREKILERLFTSSRGQEADYLAGWEIGAKIAAKIHRSERMKDNYKNSIPCMVQNSIALKDKKSAFR